jgi:hypothetical protein
MGAVMRDGWKIMCSAFKKIYPELEAAKSLSELEEVLSKNNLEVLLNLSSCSDEDSCMNLAGCVSSKNPFDVKTTICYFLGDDWDGEEFLMHLMDIPLLAVEELETEATGPWEGLIEVALLETVGLFLCVPTVVK